VRLEHAGRLNRRSHGRWRVDRRWVNGVRHCCHTLLGQCRILPGELAVGFPDVLADCLLETEGGEVVHWPQVGIARLLVPGKRLGF